MKLIKGWHTFHRWWSTWMIAIGSTIGAFAPELSEALLYAYTLIPGDIKSTFPPEVIRYFGYAVAVLAIPAKLIRQPAVHADSLKSESGADNAEERVRGTQ